MLHVKLFVYHPALLCFSMLLGNNYSTLIHSFDRVLIRIDYIYTLPFHTLETCYSTIRSLLKGLISLYFTKLSSIIFHCPINPCFWEGAGVACQTFLLSSCIAHFHEKITLPSFTLLGRDWFFYKYLHMYIYFFQEYLLSSFMPVPVHTLRKAYLTIRSLLKRLNPLCLFKRLLYHPSLLYHSILWRGQLGLFPCSMLSALIHSSLRGLIDFIYLWESLFYRRDWFPCFLSQH